MSLKVSQNSEGNCNVFRDFLGILFSAGDLGTEAQKDIIIFEQLFSVTSMYVMGRNYWKNVSCTYQFC